MMVVKQLLVVALSTLALVSSLDVEVTDYECDQSLYVTADFEVKCGESKKCTFGTSTADITGTLYYKSVYNTGVADNLAYLTTDVELLTLKYNFNEMLPVPLCYDTMTAGESNAAACPGDGSYGFGISFKLPTSGANSTSWLASGWAGQGSFRLYAQQNENMLIGKCTFNLKTYVTPAEKNGFFQTPSAAAAVGIVLGCLAAVALVMFYCYCCARKRKNKISEEGSKALTQDDLTTFFKRLDEETRSLSRESRTLMSGGSAYGGGSIGPPPGSVGYASPPPPGGAYVMPPSLLDDKKSGSPRSSVSSMAL